MHKGRQRLYWPIPKKEEKGITDIFFDLRSENVPTELHFSITRKDGFAMIHIEGSPRAKIYKIENALAALDAQTEQSPTP